MNVNAKIKIQKITNSYNLKNGLVKSCGCLKRKAIKEKRRKQNKYEFYEDYIIGYAYNDNFPFKIDLDDYDKVKEYYWYHEKHGYFISPRRDYSNKKVRLHRLIMDVQDNKTKIEVDHINRDKSDNRKENLRLCNHTENGRNKDVLDINKSKFTGVYWSKKDKTWYAQINIDGKTKHLGYQKTKEDAIKARLKAEKEYFGEFAPQRNLFKEYEIE